MIMFSKKDIKFNKIKLIICLLLLLLSVLCTLKIDYVVSADDSQGADVELAQSVSEIVESLNFDELDEVARELNDLNLFDTNIKDKVNQLLNGEYFTDFTSIGQAIFSIVFVDIKSFLPIIFTIVAIGILSTMLTNFKSDTKSTADTIYFVCFAVVVVIVLIGFKNIIFGLSSTINLIVRQMQIIFPLLITMLTAIGSLTSISIYNPLVSILTGVVSVVFDKFLYPIFMLVFILTIVGNLTDTINLNKLTSFLTSTFKWVLGFVFTIFTGFLSIQGISAGKYDSVSIKTTKFAMKSYIPLIGNYIADGMDFLILGSVLVKNTIGLIGVILIFITIISPLINIVIYKLGLQLTAAILDVSGAGRLSNFISSCSKVLILPIVILLGISFMYIITIALIMCTANIF